MEVEDRRLWVGWLKHARLPADLIGSVKPILYFDLVIIQKQSKSTACGLSAAMLSKSCEFPYSR